MADLTMSVGQTAKIQCVSLNSDNTLTPPATLPVTWASSDLTKVAFRQANPDGTHLVVVAIGAGSATLTATSGLNTKTYVVAVNAAPTPSFTSLQITPSIMPH
jgi:uncharacterized protein YjdB